MAGHRPAGALGAVGDGHPGHEELLQLQRLAGNHAVASLLARQPSQPEGGTAPDPTAATDPAPDPLDDERIAWIDDLEHRALRETIDSLGDRVNHEYRVIDLKLKKAKDEAERKKLTGQRDELDRKVHDKRVQSRHAFLAYVECTLGGLEGTKDYFSNQLVSFMHPDLIVHRTVAERLEKVRAELEAAGLPMPETTVGQSLRGDHNRSKRERNSPGMLGHAMGYAVDWHAYRNPHLKDPQLQVLIEAVTGESNRMALPAWGERRTTIKAMGKASMGQGTAPTGQQAFLDTIGTEFDRLTALSATFRGSLPAADRSELATLHTELKAALAAVARTGAQLAAARRKKAKPDVMAAANDAALKALEQLRAKKAEIPPKLERIFAPWRDKIAKRVEAMEKEAADLGIDLRMVQPEDWLAPLRKEVKGGAKAQKPFRQRIAKVERDAAGAAKGIAAVVGKAEAFQAWLDDDAKVAAARGVTPDQLATWRADLPTVRDAARKSLTGAEALRVQAQAALGAKAPTPTKVAALKARKYGDRDLNAWRAALAAGDAKVQDALGRFPAAQAGLDAAVAALKSSSDRLAAYEQQNKQIKESIAKSKAVTWKQLVWRRKRLTYLEKASQSLVTDLDFVFKDLDAGDPGITQLMGAAYVPNTRRTGNPQGGGFFEPSAEPGTDAEKATAAKLAAQKKMSYEYGFGKLFYQAMAKYGFDLGAAWDNAQDTMHFELVEGIESIVDPDSCAKAPQAGTK